MRLGLATFVAALLIGVSGAAHAAEVLREQRIVTVGGVQEVWRLVWSAKPALVCGPNEIDMAMTCPCSGWAYGETGDLSLARSRGGREVERLQLGRFFGVDDYPARSVRDGDAYLQRWPMRESDIDRDLHDDPTLLRDIRHRPVTEVMRLADYDHDGQATEFLLQVGTLPCGKHELIAVGVSAAQPRLHALTTVARPGQALEMGPEAWRALLANPNPAPLTFWSCGDHGSDERSELHVSAAQGRVRAEMRHYSCPGPGERERLLSVEAQ